MKAITEIRYISDFCRERHSSCLLSTKRDSIGNKNSELLRVLSVRWLGFYYSITTQGKDPCKPARNKLCMLPVKSQSFLLNKLCYFIIFVNCQIGIVHSYHNLIHGFCMLFTRSAMQNHFEYQRSLKPCDSSYNIKQKIWQLNSLSDVLFLLQSIFVPSISFYMSITPNCINITWKQIQSASSNKIEECMNTQ